MHDELMQWDESEEGPTTDSTELPLENSSSSEPLLHESADELKIVIAEYNDTCITGA